MSKELNKSYIFFKNLFRPGGITPSRDKKLTFVDKLIVAHILKPRKFKEIPSTISYFEWNYVKSKFKIRLTIAVFVLSPVVSWFILSKPARNSQDRWMEKTELKKYGETRENETFYRWFPPAPKV